MGLMGPVGLMGRPVGHETGPCSWLVFGRCAADANAEAFEVDVFALFRIARAAAIDADAYDAPQAGGFAGVVVAVGIGVAFEQPAPGASFAAARHRFLLPTFEHPRQGLERGSPGFGVADLEP